MHKTSRGYCQISQMSEYQAEASHISRNYVFRQSLPCIKINFPNFVFFSNIFIHTLNRRLEHTHTYTHARTRNSSGCIEKKLRLNFSL